MGPLAPLTGLVAGSGLVGTRCNELTPGGWRGSPAEGGGTGRLVGVGLGRIERRPGYRLWVGGPVPPGAAAWTLGSLVIVRRRHADSPHLIAHELEHVRQYHDLGFVGFLVRYLWAYAGLVLRGYGHQAAYRRIPAEVSAEWRARRLLHIGTD